MAEVRAAAEPDLALVRRLLEQAGLPTSDLTSSKPEFIVLWENGGMVAAGALESFGSAALMRSVVVAADRRGTGLGRRVVQELEKAARAARIRRLVLLTETAAEFFTHQGYRAIERTEVPQAVQESAEFRALCPASATCMMKVLSESG